MRQVMRNERGMALALAIVALVIVGALVAGAFFAGTQEQRNGENSRYSQRSFGVAEGAANYIIGHWDPQRYNTVGIYPTDSVQVVDTASPSNTGRYAGYVYRLNEQQYLIDVTGRDSTSIAGGAEYVRRGSAARERIGILARIKPLEVDVRASLTSGRGDALAGNASIDGTDHVPTGWTTCGPLDSTKAGIRTDTSMSVSAAGASTIIGNPPVIHDPNITDSTFSKYGDVTYTQLAARAQLTLAGGQNFASNIGPVETNGVCDKTVFTNWGDGENPTAPCGGYFPIVHIQGDAVVNGVQGQGILLVDGTLTVQGGFQWFGITIVRGTLNTAGGGSTAAHFWGATMVEDSTIVGNNTLTGHANLLYSKCAILKALDQTGVVAMMRSRGWVQLY
jgi:hypothetical protein